MQQGLFNNSLITKQISDTAPLLPDPGHDRDRHGHNHDCHGHSHDCHDHGHDCHGHGHDCHGHGRNCGKDRTQSSLRANASGK